MRPAFKALLVVLVMVACTANAQTFELASARMASYTISPVIVPPSAQGSYSIPGLRMRNTGRTLTLVGGALFLGGIIVYSSADKTYYSSYSSSNGTVEEGDPKAALGIGMMLGGAGMVVPGIIFWNKGAKKYNAYQEQQTASFNFKGNGVSLTYRF